MPHDPTGRYKGNRYDPDYAAKKKWRQQQWQSQQGPSHPSVSSPSRYSSSLSYDPHSPGGRPFGSGGGEASDQGFRNNMMEGYDSHSAHSHRPTPYYDTGAYPVNPVYPHQAPQEYYRSPAPSTPHRGGMEGGANFAMDTSPRPDPSPPTLAHGPGGDSKAPESDSKLSLSSLLPGMAAQSQASPAAATPSTATPTVELSSLEKLKLFKAQVEATRRSNQQQQQQQQPSLQQLDTARAAESFLLNVSSAAATPSSDTSSAVQIPAPPLQDTSSVPSAPPSTQTPPVPATTVVSSDTTSIPPYSPSHPTPSVELPRPAPQNHEEGGQDSREAREQALKEKLRLKLAQKAASSDASSVSTPTDTAAAGPQAQQAPPAPAPSTEHSNLDTADRRPQEASRPAERPNGNVSQISRPAPSDQRQETRLEQRLETRTDGPPRRSYAEMARQRFAARTELRDRPSPRTDHGLERQESSRGRSASPPRRPSSPRRIPSERGYSPTRSLRRSPPPREMHHSDPPPRHDRSTSFSEYGPDKPRTYERERRPSHSSAGERRPYERPPPSLHHDDANEAYSYSTDRGRGRELKRDAQAMPPPERVVASNGTPRVARPTAIRDDSPPRPASKLEVWALKQIQLLKQQNESIEKQISEMEKLLRAGAIRPSTITATVSPTPASASAAPTPSRRDEYRQEYRQEYRPEPRPEQRLEQRMEPREESRLEHRLEYRPDRTPYPDSRPVMVREPSPAPQVPVSRGYATPPPGPSYDEVREHRSLSASHGKPPYGSKEYDYGEAQRGEYRPPQDSYDGKAPSYKTYARPYKPFDKRPVYEMNGRERAVSPPPSRYSSSVAGGRPMDRRGSYDGRAPKRQDLGYRY